MARLLLNVSSATVGTIVNTTIFKSESPIGLSQTMSVRNIFSITVDKKRSNAESFLLVRGIMPIHGMVNWPCIGNFVNIDGGRMGLDEEAYGGWTYSMPTYSRESGLAQIDKGFDDAVWNSFQAAGSHTVNIGWYSPHSSATAPGNTVNFTQGSPNIDSRCHQTGSHIVVFEVLR